MKTLIINLYKFDELEPLVQNKTIEKYRYLNTEDTDWWVGVYEDAANADLVIEGFDFDGKGHCNIKIPDIEASVAYILDNHGDKTETYEAAYRYSRTKSFHQFKWDIQDAYLKMLSEEYDYQMSDMAITEALKAEGWEFTECGDRFNP